MKEERQAATAQNQLLMKTNEYRISIQPPFQAKPCAGGFDCCPKTDHQFYHAVDVERERKEHEKQVDWITTLLHDSQDSVDDLNELLKEAEKKLAELKQYYVADQLTIEAYRDMHEKSEARVAELEKKLADLKVIAKMCDEHLKATDEKLVDCKVGIKTEHDAVIRVLQNWKKQRERAEAAEAKVVELREEVKRVFQQRDESDADLEKAEKKLAEVMALLSCEQRTKLNPTHRCPDCSSYVELSEAVK